MRFRCPAGLRSPRRGSRAPPSHWLCGNSEILIPGPRRRREPLKEICMAQAWHICCETHVALMWTHVGLMWDSCGLMWDSCGLMWDSCELMLLLAVLRAQFHALWALQEIPPSLTGPVFWRQQRDFLEFDLPQESRYPEQTRFFWAKNAAV